MHFAFSYHSNTGDTYYCYLSNGEYVAFIFDSWLNGETPEELIYEIDSYCLELIRLANQG